MYAIQTFTAKAGEKDSRYTAVGEEDCNEKATGGKKKEKFVYDKFKANGIQASQM